MLTYSQRFLLFFCFLTFCLIAGCAHTILRGPTEPPDTRKMRLISDFSRNINNLSLAATTKLVQDVLDAFFYPPHLPHHKEGKTVITTSLVNIEKKIKDYKDHFVMLIFSIELNGNGENVEVLWRYGVCQASFKSRYWVYDKIPYPVLKQVKEEIAGKVFNEFVNRANAKSA